MRTLLFSILCASGAEAFAVAPVTVASLAELEEAIAGAAPGARIVVADGVYTCDSGIRIRCAGTLSEPIVIEAQSIGGAEIRGSDGFTLEPPAAWVVVRGFRFTHEAGTMHILAGVHHCRITRNVFELAVEDGQKAAYLIVRGDDNEIDHNTFAHKATEGQMLYVQGPGKTGMAQRTWIHHNYFFDFKPTANNCSALHIGHSARSLTPAHSVVEHNLFVKCRGENEGAICNKSCNNVYRYNTIGEGSTELSLRHGNHCFVYGNDFIGSSGIRFFGDHHRIYSNYFERCRPAIAIGNGGANVPPARLTSHDRPDGVHVVYNTLVDNRRNVRMSGRRGGLGATDLVFANNLILGGDAAVSVDGPLADPTWEGNILWNNAGGPGAIPAAGFVSLDPQLRQDEDGLYRLQPGSPAIGRGLGDYGYVAVDIDGQDRAPALDVGGDQVSDRPIVRRVLTVADVGPQAPQGVRSLLSAPKDGHLFLVGAAADAGARDPGAVRPAPTWADVAYGPHERHRLDLWAAESERPTPLVLYIHGGGFRGGSKESLGAGVRRSLLEAGISVAACNYRLLAQARLPAAHHDCRRALQFLRHRADHFRIDPQRVGAFGGSAGAQICMWLAFHDDMARAESEDPLERQSTRLQCVGTSGGQTTMDFEWWIRHIPGYDRPHRPSSEYFGEISDAERARVVRAISALSLLSADDPPIYMSYGMSPDAPVPPTPDAARGWRVHHVNFGVALREAAGDHGVEAHLTFPGATATAFSSLEEFLKAELRRGPAADAVDAADPGP